MAIFIDKNTKVLVQGITGRDGTFHTEQMVSYGGQVVAGVTPGKGGQEVHGVPVFNSVAEGVGATGANTSVIYVPAPFAADAIFEATLAGIGLVVCITEGVPINDMLKVYDFLRGRSTRLIGPNCPGAITPGECKVGIIPGTICESGSVGVVSRSGTLTYEVVHALTRGGFGQSTCVGIGGDPVAGTSFIDCLDAFERDEKTKAVAMIGEIGGDEEERAARFVAERMTKPVAAYIAGRAAPPGKRMGHAGAIISGGSGTAAAKVEALEAAGVSVAVLPSELPDLVRQMGVA
ncbi:MAG: succinate--CoA ligase subunit alpha [Gemmatimonadetes bacterium]|nr:succinate--CoA ligase subunit alpha [Gemmatimonadota bacterium]